MRQELLAELQSEQTRKALGYDQPVIVQWTDFLQGVVKGREYPDDPELREEGPRPRRRTAPRRAWATPW